MIRVQGSRKRAKPFHQRMGRGVEELIRDAEDLAAAHRAEVVPVALLDDTGERNAVSGAAPGEDQDVGIGGGDFFGGGVEARLAKVLTASGGNQLGDPVLGADQGLAPFLAIDRGVRERVSDGAGGGEFGFAGGDEVFTRLRRRR